MSGKGIYVVRLDLSTRVKIHLGVFYKNLGRLLKAVLLGRISGGHHRR